MGPLPVLDSWYALLKLQVHPGMPDICVCVCERECVYHDVVARARVRGCVRLYVRVIFRRMYGWIRGLCALVRYCGLRGCARSGACA